jgi:hypothetical protein
MARTQPTVLSRRPDAWRQLARALIRKAFEDFNAQRGYAMTMMVSTHHHWQLNVAA